VAEPQPILNLVHFSLKNLTSGGNNFNDFLESQLTKFQTFMPGLIFADVRGMGAGSAPSKYAPDGPTVETTIAWKTV